jgi:lipopolysaccharide export system protein LptA
MAKAWWLGVAAAGSAMAAAQSDEVRIEFPRSRIDFVSGEVIYEGGVTVRYGPTQIQAEELRVLYGERNIGTARGNVVLTDPEGTVRAANIRIVWNDADPTDREATAETVQVDVAGVRLRAERMRLTPDEWVFEGALGTNCVRGTPVYAVYSPRVVITPGKRGRIERPRLELFGKSIITLPSQSFLLDRRVKGIGLPSIQFDGDQGFGVGWSAQILAGPNAALEADFEVFQRTRPSFGVIHGKSFLPQDRQLTRIISRSDLTDRFHFGWFDTIEIDRPHYEIEFNRQARNTLAVATAWNRKPVRGGEALTKPLELIYDRSAPVGPLGVYAQARLQSIGTSVESSRVRAAGYLSASLPEGALPGGFRSLIRFDLAGNTSGNGYGWARAQFGAYRPLSRQLTFGVAGILATDTGTPAFGFDALESEQAVHLRLDLNTGPTRVYWMQKYDRRLGWYDREYAVSQVIGCIEAFVLYRQNPQSYRFGAKFRIDDFVDRLFDREPRRRVSGESPP